MEPRSARARVTPSRRFALKGSTGKPTRIAHSPFTIGRDCESGQVLSHPLVSRVHAVVLEQPGQ
jgi:pSer/pThr/pTyr-binding forkhead associated (FHA) protein